MAERPIIVIDALCPLCSSGARFVLKRDRRGEFLFASMQSEAGAALARRFGVDPAEPETVILVAGGRARRDSDAILAILAQLGWPWKAAGLLRLVPRRLRDAAYRWVARNRYRLSGRRDACWAPPDRHRDRLL